ncbi:MAG: metalloregulator ArsR/SmtB family transcription factor [Candidatus Roizmanbacteria bacterium]
MVKYNDRLLNKIFGVLADKTRRSILNRIVTYGSVLGQKVDPMGITVSEIAQFYTKKMSLPAISKHLKKMEKSGLIERTKTGKTHHFKINMKNLMEIESFLEHYRQTQQHKLSRLEELMK